MTEPMVRVSRSDSTRVAGQNRGANGGNRSYREWSNGAGADCRAVSWVGTRTSSSRLENKVGLPGGGRMGIWDRADARCRLAYG
jgi:hypothetical protein